MWKRNRILFTFSYKKVGRWTSSQNVKLLMKGSPPVANKKSWKHISQYTLLCKCAIVLSIKPML